MLDLAAHDRLGNHFRVDDVRYRRSRLLRPSVSFGLGGSWIFPRHDFLSPKLVHCFRESPNRRTLHDRRTAVRRNRRPNLRRVARHSSGGWSGWLAMAIPAGRNACHPPRDCRLLPPQGSSPRCAVALAGGAFLVGGNLAPRRELKCDIWRGAVVEYFSEPPSVLVGIGLFLFEYQFLRHQPLAAERDQRPFEPQQLCDWSALRHSLHRSRDRYGLGRTPFEPHRSAALARRCFSVRSSSASFSCLGLYLHHRRGRRIER